MSGSHHNNQINIQKEMFGMPAQEWPKLSDPRWSCCFATHKNLPGRLSAVMRVLEENPQNAVDARGLRSQTDSTGLLMVFRKFLGETKILSEKLQSINVDPAKAADLNEALRQTFEDCLKEESFDELWRIATETCSSCHLSTIAKSKRPKQTSSRLSDSLSLIYIWTENKCQQQRCLYSLYIPSHYR